MNSPNLKQWLREGGSRIAWLFKGQVTPLSSEFECPTPIFHGDFPFVSLFFFYKNILYAYFYRFMLDIIYIGIEIYYKYMYIYIKATLY